MNKHQHIQRNDNGNKLATRTHQAMERGARFSVHVNTSTNEQSKFCTGNKEVDHGGS